MAMLPADEIVEVLKTDRPQDYFVGGTVDKDDGKVVLYRGSLEWMAVPFSFFARSGRGIEPDFGDFEVIDCGQTLRFGSYEAASEAVLYAYDADARKRMQANELAHDASFGAALRRLRLLKKVSREDFPGVAAKTIARIERGEVEKPQGATLAKIAERLEVSPSEIETY
jgi:DNA-binding Xre family transcriptional regulator